MKCLQGFEDVYKLESFRSCGNLQSKTFLLCKHVTVSRVHRLASRLGMTSLHDSVSAFQLILDRVYSGTRKALGKTPNNAKVAI